MVNFEVLEPATVSIPESTRSIAVLNRAPFCPEVFDDEDIVDLTWEQLKVVDTLICNNILKGLNSVLRQAPVKKYHFPVWLSERRLDTFGLDIPLTKREVSDFSEKFGNNLIISLEYYGIDIDEIEHFDEEDLISIYYKISNEVKWAIYREGSPRPYNEYITHDTLYFLFYNYTKGYVPGHSSADMVREIFFESGVNYGRYLVPSWIQISRPIYRGKEKGLKQAVKYTDSGEWENAYKIWEGLLDNRDSTLAAKAAFNMAVFYELEDNLDSARHFLVQSMKMDSTEITESYLEDLEIRILNRQEVIQQVKR